MDILLTGSVAYDYLMTFPGLFSEQILPERLKSISLSFLVDSMAKARGGIAPNIAYTMALLGEKPRVMATVGEDFAEYRAWLDKQGVDTSPDEGDPRRIHRLVLCHDRPGFRPNCLLLPGSDGALRFAIPQGPAQEARPGGRLAQCAGCDDEVPGRMPRAGHSLPVRSEPAGPAAGRRGAGARHGRRSLPVLQRLRIRSDLQEDRLDLAADARSM